MTRLVVLSLALLLTLSVLPVLAEGRTEVSDTLYVIKENEQPSNADIAVTLSQATPLTPDRVLIGRDDVFVDSMTSGVLQGDSPLLLVPPEGPVPASVLTELQRLDPSRVTLLGGERALTPAVADEFAARGYAVDRRSGPSRFETAIAIADDGPHSRTAILARAFADDGAGDPTQAFADSLAAGGMAAENGWPILLTGTDDLAGPTADYMAQQGFDRVLILGGTAAVSTAVEQQVRALATTVDRISGANRFSTGIEVAKELGADSAADVDRVTLVDAQGPDAWAGGFAAAAHSALFDAPIVLGTGDVLPDATMEWLAGGAFAGPGSFRLTCVIDSDICEDGRQALSLPPAVPVVFTPADGGTVVPGGTVQVDVGTANAQVAGGSCVNGQSGPLTDNGQVSITSQPADATCDLQITIELAAGVTQTEQVTYIVGQPQSVLALVSIDADGNAVGGRYPDIGDAGSAIVYVSDGNPTGTIDDGAFHVFRIGGEGTELVDVGTDGQPSSGVLLTSFATRPRVSLDGQRVIFQATDNDLEDGTAVTGSGSLAYVRDFEAGTTTLVSRGADGVPVGSPTFLTLSDDGQVAAFVGNGVGPTGADSVQVFIRNLSTGALDVVRDGDGDPFLNAQVAGLDLSADGSVLVFNSDRPDLVAGDFNTRDDTFAYTVATQALELVSVNDQGEQTSDDTVGIDPQLAVSADGRQVVFGNAATNLAGGPGSAGGDDVFLRNRDTQTTLLISRGDGMGEPLGQASMPDLSGDGRFITFRSSVAPDDAPSDVGCGIYLSRTAGPPQRIDVAADGTVNTNGCSNVEFATVSTAGLVAFSVFGRLTPQDTNDVGDVYLYLGALGGG